MSIPEVGQEKLLKDTKAKGSTADSCRSVQHSQGLRQAGNGPLPDATDVSLPNEAGRQEQSGSNAAFLYSCDLAVGKPTHKVESSPQDAILASNTYKELNRKFVMLKREQAEER